MKEWLSMDGYAVFVWGSFAASLVVYVWMLWAPRGERRALLETEEDDE